MLPHHSLPAEVQVLELEGGGAAFLFPRRDLGALRRLAWVPILIGLFILGFMVVWTSGFAGGFFMAFGPLGLLAGLFALPGLLAGSAVIGIGLAMLYGRSELRRREDRISCTERVGPVSWTRHIRANRIQRLEVSGLDSLKSSSRPVDMAPLSDLAALGAQLDNGKKLLLVLGYPRPWLLALAEALANEIHEVDVQGAKADVPVVAVADLPVVSAGEVDRFEPPEECDIDYQELTDGFALNVPARGLWKGGGGLFVFGLIWCGFLTLFTAVFAFAAGNGPGNPQDRWIVIPFLGLFWLAGAGLLLGAVALGRRRAGLAVADRRLLAIEIGLFGTKRREWNLDELLTVRVGPSGTEINDRPLMQLQIVPRSGPTAGFLTGRDEQELEWMATLLRHAVRPDNDVPHTSAALPNS